MIELSWGSGGHLSCMRLISGTVLVCDELQRFKYENENRLKPIKAGLVCDGMGVDIAQK